MPTRWPVAPTIDRLRQQVARLKIIEPCTDIKAAIEQNPRAFPAAFVVTVRSGAKPAGASGGMLIQPIVIGLQVVLFVSNFARSDTGSAAAADMDLLVDEVDAALLNWAPDAAFAPLSLATGQDVPYGGKGVLITHNAYRSKCSTRATRKT